MTRQGRGHGLSTEARAVVIGGSAGAFHALISLLSALPSNFAIPIAIVVHLPRRSPSMLAQVLAARCGRRVCEVQDKEPVLGSTVYVAPADYHLLIDEGPVFALSVDEPVNHSLPAIDPLFESAANVYGSSLVGIVLSGASDDGAMGLRAIEQAGGLALVQSPSEAANGHMPAAALAACKTARVLDTSAMSEVLSALVMG